MQKYNIYSGELKNLTSKIKYCHYEHASGRLLIFVPKKPAGEWKKLTEDEIKRLTPHERHWYNSSRNSVNAEYLSKPQYQKELIRKFDSMLDAYEDNLKKLNEQLKTVKDEQNGEAENRYKEQLGKPDETL